MRGKLSSGERRGDVGQGSYGHQTLNQWETDPTDSSFRLITLGVGYLPPTSKDRKGTGGVRSSIAYSPLW
jgi:hypothetical protein